MAYWNMLKKLRGHGCLQAGEEPIAAVYGLGEMMLSMADAASQGLADRAGTNDQIDGPDRYHDEFLAATEGRHRDGNAARIEGNGVLGLTNRRLLWFKKATVVGKPGEPAAAFPVSSLIQAERVGNMIRVVFVDGSVSSLHVPRSQKPETFVTDVNRIVTP